MCTQLIQFLLVSLNVCYSHIILWKLCLKKRRGTPLEKISAVAAVCRRWSMCIFNVTGIVAPRF